MENPIKISQGIAILAACLLIAILFITQSSKQLDTVARYIPPNTQLAAVSGAGSGLIADWSFDEGSGTTVGDSVGGVTLNLNNSSWPADNVGNFAVSFTGVYGSYGQSTAQLSVPANGFSYSFWIKVPSGGAPTGAILSWNDERFCRFGGVTPNTINCTVTGSSGSSAATTAQLNDGQWHHIVFTSTTNTQQIYVDGVLQGAASQTLATNSGSVSVGSYIWGSGGINGSLDDVRIYDHTLSTTDITSLFALGGTSGGGTSPGSVGDTTAPSIPVGLSTTVVSSSQINLSWTASTDAVGVTGYKIYRNGTQIGTSASNSYSDSGLNQSTSYSYTVSAYDAMPNNSAQSSSVSATTQSGLPVAGSGTCEAVSPSKCWYIDNAATGVNDGTSWTNAWTSFSRQSSLGLANWSMIQPGDFVYISGGSVSKTYTNMMIEPGVSGVIGKPITIKVGQDIGHNGLVIVDGAYVNTNYYGIYIKQNYITVSGQVGSDPNPHMKITHAYTHGVYIYGDIHDFNISYLDITQNGLDQYPDHTNKASQSPSDFSSEGIYVMVKQHPSLGEIHHLKVHDNHGDEMDFIELYQNSSSVSSFSSLKVHDNDIYNWHADAVKIFLGGTDFYNNKIRDRGVHIFDHPDGIQAWSSYLRIFNNELYNFDSSPNISATDWDNYGANSFIRYNPGNRGGNISDNTRYVYIYNNLFYETLPPRQRPASYGSMVTRGIELTFSNDPGFPNPIQSVRHIYVANNVFYKIPFYVLSVSLDRTFAMDIADVMIVNNILIDNCNRNTICSSFALFDKGYNNTATYGGVGSSASMIVDHNVIFTSDLSKYNVTNVGLEGPSATSIYGYSAIFTYPEFKNLYPGFQSHDITTDPLIDSTFHPQTGSPAIDAGVSMSNAFTVDRSGNSRPQGLAWDIGVFESAGGRQSVVTGPVLKLNFDGDNFSTGIFADKSGNNNNANCQNSFALNGTTYNQCPTSAVGPDGSIAARFQGIRCDLSSDYLAVSKNSSFDNLTKGTISVWGAFDDNTSLQSKILDTYGGTNPNTWLIGRDGDKYMTFTANTDSGAAVDLFTFPGGNETLGSWNNYAITWDGTTIRGYYNGTYFGQVSQQYFSKFKLGTYLALGTLNHGDIRNSPDNNCVNYYGGDPTKSYVQPNDGFLNGKIDDVQIYDRPLSSGEITSLASIVTTPSNTYVLSLQKIGAGSGMVNGSGLSCGKHCAEAYNPSTSVTLTAVPQEGSAFSGWGGSCSGTGTCTVTMNTNKPVTANFIRTYPIIASYEAEAGTISAPFVASGGAVYQNILTSNPLLGGKAVYNFTITTPGDYIVSSVIDAPSQSNNSFFVNIDAEPTIDDVWYTNTTAGFEEQIVSWGGYSDGGNPSHVFTLSAGTHTLIIRGREESTYLDKVYILQKGGTATSILGDFNHDGMVNSIDLSSLIDHWNTNNSTYDLNADGIVNSLDYVIMVQNWSM